MNMMRWGVKTFELYDKEFKKPSKSSETVPLSSNPESRFYSPWQTAYQTCPSGPVTRCRVDFYFFETKN
jgi:hypothetical protein